MNDELEVRTMAKKFSTKCPHFFPQHRRFYIDVLRVFSTKMAPLVFSTKICGKVIYTKYLTQPFFGSSKKFVGRSNV
jgi:hypothetical protein